MQRVVGIALGYEDLNDHDELRHDQVLGGVCWPAQLEAQRLGLRRAAGRQINALKTGWN